MTYRQALLQIADRYEREQRDIKGTPCGDSARWGLPWAMYQDACEALKRAPKSWEGTSPPAGGVKGANG